MKWAIALFALAGGAGAQAPLNPYEAARAAMEASIAKQRASVQRQVEAVWRVGPPPAAEGAANQPSPTVPWPAAVSMLNAADCDPLPEQQVNALVQDASEREGVAVDLVRAVIRKESGFRPCAVSPKGAQGLMQLMPATAQMLNVGDPFDSRQSIDAGTHLLKQLLTRYSGDLALALGAYNAGTGAVDRNRGVPPIPETLNYVSDILKRVQ
jgi:soluble lytic murein transglycosylase-like protein